MGAGMSAKHPGDVLWRDLPADWQSEIARGWENQPAVPADLFDGLTDSKRHEILCTLPGRNGGLPVAAEQAHIAARVDPATNGAFDRITRASPAAPCDLFRRWKMAELLAEPDSFEWLVRGLLAQPTYGQVAGEMKTLKSYVLGFITVGLAAGEPIFDRFAPAESRPVLAYVGEGGRSLWTRRIRRICSAMDVDPADIDLHPSFDVAPIPSMVFQESLRRDLDELGPALVALDPLYTYHGTATRASDLHQEGSLLNLLSRPCIEAGASLLAVNHMNQTGAGMSLKRITMAGSGEWADSWLLLEHRETADVESGLFRLRLEIGSRQWGGTAWHLDLDIGRFDMDTGTHDGRISWDLARATTTSSSEKTSGATEKARDAILEALVDCPWTLTKTDVKKLVGGSKDIFETTFDDLAQRDVDQPRPQGPGRSRIPRNGASCGA